MASVRVRGLEIAYERAGDGPPLVLLHGAMGDSRFWRRQLDGLADEFTVVAWDEPGAGHSSDVPDRFTLADYADCLAGLIDGLGLAPAHVAGLSWGGMIAMGLFERHPRHVTSLVLADTYAGWRGSLPAAECEARLAVSRRLAEAPFDDPSHMWAGLLSPRAAPGLREELAEIMGDTRPSSLLALTRIMEACDLRALLPRIDVPTLLVWGEDDERSPLGVAEQFRDAIPGARLVLVPGAGHVSSMEAPRRFNAAVRDFCRGL